MKNEGENMKKICAVHDLTGFGRCGLSVAIPVISAMGHQACPLPTSILSTHPMFQNYFMKNSEYIQEYVNHLKEVDIKFDCLYSGYLAKEEQIDIVKEFAIYLKEKHGTYLLIDPVMGDYGKAYKITSSETIKKMKEFVKCADLITPNITETAFLLDEKPKETYTDLELKEMLEKLHDIYGTKIIITGISIDEKYSVNYLYTENKIIRYEYEVVKASYPGTGDVFASILAGYLMKGFSLEKSFVETGKKCLEIIKYTYEQNTDHKEGVLFEKYLKSL